MTWKLFLDDSAPVPAGWVLARDVAEAIALVNDRGMPVAMSLDHDLATRPAYPERPPAGPSPFRIIGLFRKDVLVDPTGLDFVGWLWEHVRDRRQSFPDGFTYYIHTANPLAAELMGCLMEELTGQPPSGWRDWWRA